jgi:hypothetical protein
MATFTGEVYDIDYIENNNWCQFLLRNKEEPMNIVVVTDSHKMQTILETAMAMRQMAEVTFDEKEPKKLTRVKLNIG